jgi:hypothetical protein
MWKDERLDACRSRPFQPCGVGSIGNHDRDLGVEPSSCHRIDDRLKVRATT